MSYDIVVATRNRIDMLRHSLSLFLGQTLPPRRLVVVDASDDHGPVARFCAGLSPAGTEVIAVQAEQRNLPAQRNQGLALVEAPVVAMPDDDSLWYPDTGAALVEAYAVDTAGAVGAINAMDMRTSPLATIEAGLRPTPVARLRSLIGPARRFVENRLAPHPFDVFGHERIAALRGPERVDTARLPLVPTVGGYRMSFRTEAIRAVGFNATLGYAVGYAQHEDKDAAMRLLAAGWLIAAAPKARVFHNVHPSKRSGGFAYGFCQIYNYAYICRTAFDQASGAWRYLGRYLWLKRQLYALRRADSYGREVHEGATAAAAAVPALLEAPAAAVETLFRETCDRHLR
jgi:GT2 family glycosyltransferase